MKTTFTGNSSMIFLGKMLKCTDERLVTSRFCKRDNKKIEILMNEVKPEREKLVLKFTRCPTLDCAKEEDLMKRRCEWKVSTPSSIQANTAEENVEESNNEAPNRIESADLENLFKIVDVSDPWSEIKEGRIRRVKEVTEVRKLCASKIQKKRNSTHLKTVTTELANSNAFKKEEVLSKCLFVISQKTSSSKKPKNSFTNYKAGLKRLRSKRPTKEIRTSTGIQNKVSSKPFFVVGKKTSSLNKPKNSFRDYLAYKAGLKRYNRNRSVKQNQISKNFQIKKARKRL